MTPQRFADVVKTITFGWPLKAFGFRVRISKVPVDPHGLAAAWESVFVVFTFNHIPDRETGYPAKTARTVRLYPEGLKTDADAILFVLREAQKSMGHEIEESLLVDGRRHFDPHAPGANGVIAP